MKVTKCPPGPITDDMRFQSWANYRQLGRRWAVDPNPPDVNTPREYTLEDVLGVSALSLREIMNDDEED